MPEPIEIEITYSKRRKGQVGRIPKKIPLNAEFVFTTKDEGELTIKFTGNSPLKKGLKSVPANTAVTAAKEGNFPFICTLVDPQGQKHQFGNPEIPDSGVGGELEVVP